MDISQNSIIVCGIVRNAEKGLRMNFPVVDKLCKQFAAYKIVIYENDSIDNTKQILAEWRSADAENVHVVMEDNDKSSTIPSTKNISANPFFSEKRISKMANLRNKYLEYIDGHGWTADYLMVVDFDVASIDYDGIISSFDTDIEWDAVTSFGYSLSPKFRRRYHDSYALVEFGNEKCPQTETSIIQLQEKYGGLKPSDNWIRVYSAFGGLAIYRFDAIKQLRYHVLKNGDSRVEVRCEHFSLCKQMHDNGYDKIFINPKMALKYQNLTFKICWNSFVRNLAKHS